MQRFLAFVLAVLMGAPAFADSPVIWNGPYARNLTSKGFLLSNGAQLNNDGPVNYAPQRAIKWTVSGSVTATDDTTAADLARANTTGNGIIFAATGAGNAFFCAALDTADYNKKLALQWDQNATAGAASTYVAGDFQVDVSSATNSTCTTGVTRLPLSTDVSSLSPLPALSGTYRTTFDTPGSAAAFIKVQVTRVNNSHSIVLSNVYVGPQQVAQGAALTQDISYTPTSSISTNATLTGTYHRVGNYISAQIFIVFSGVNTQGGVTFTDAQAFNGLSLTVDTSGFPTTSTSEKAYPVGTWNAAQPGTADGYAGLVWYRADTSTFTLSYPTAAGTRAFVNTSSNTPFTIASGNTISVNFMAPISQWAGSGTVNVVQNQPLYYATSGTWDADSSTTIYGTTGQAIGGTLATVRAKTMTLSGQPGATDIVRLEIDPAGTGQWVDMIGASSTTSALGIMPLTFTTSGIGTNSVGVLLQRTGATTYVAQFGRYYGASLDGSTVLGAWSDWSATSGRWRLAWYPSGQAIGFGQVTQLGAGLVTAAGQLLGTNTNDAASLGNAGEILGPISRVRSGLTTLTTNTAVNVGTTAKITLTAGDWRMQGMVCFQAATTTAITELEVGISKTTATLPALDTIGVPTSGEVYFDDAQPWTASGTDDHCISIPPYRYSVAAGATQDLYLVALGKFTVSSLKVYGSMYAERAR